MKQIAWDYTNNPKFECCALCKHVDFGLHSGEEDTCEHPDIVSIYPNGYPRIIGILGICSRFELEE